MLLPSCAMISLDRSSRVINLLRKLSLALCAALLLLLCLPSQSLAQDEPNDTDVIRVTTDLLLFPIRVRDKNKQAVEGLAEHDLELIDRDKVTSGIYFAAGTDRVAMVFALDQSGSLREIISQQRDAAFALFQHFSSKSHIAVLRFTDVVSVAAPFDGDQSSARSAFSYSSARDSHTAIFDAAEKAVEQFDQLPKVRTERRIVILISDGLDTASRLSAKSVIDSAVENHVSFYVIHLPLYEPRDGRLVVRTPAKGFRDLAEKTGGKYFLVGNARQALVPSQVDLAPIFKAVEDDLKSQYLLGFYIAETSKDGRKHIFSVNLRRTDTQFSVGQLDYSRTHKFSVNLKPGETTKPQ